ncbi:MAG: LysR family transcriptional regulator [Sphingomonadales bacterium]
MDWAAIQDFLAVAETGSLSAAARRLRVSQPTMGRRISALESELGTSLFVRTRRGLGLTDTGGRILDHARKMEHEALAVDRIAGGSDQMLEGSVRITATEGLTVQWLTPRLMEFRDRYPGIRIELISDNTAANLMRREADIAIRMFRPRQAELIARRIGTIAYGLYASTEYLRRHGTPENIASLRQHYAVAPDESLVQLSKESWQRFERMFGERRVAYRSNSFLAQLNAVRAGFGIGAFACPMVKRDPDLVRLLESEMQFVNEMWLVAHSELRRNARIRAVYDFLAELAERHRAELNGDCDCD